MPIWEKLIVVGIGMRTKDEPFCLMFERTDKDVMLSSWGKSAI